MYDKTDVFPLDSGYKYDISMVKADKTYIVNSTNITVADNTISVTMTKQMLAAAGTAKCELIIRDGEEILFTDTFYLYIEENVQDGSHIESSDEYNSVVDVLNRVDGYEKEVIKKKEHVDSMSDEIDKTYAELEEAVDKTNELIQENETIKANEEQRKTDETIRQANEEKRQKDTATAISNAEKATKRANDATDDLQNKLDSHHFVLTEDKDVAGGVPSLDSNAKVPLKELYEATTSSKGITQLTDSVTSTSTTTAATPNSVKTVNDALTTEKNRATSAESTIRDLITGLTTRLNALADSDDTTLDQLSEIVAYIKANRTLIENVTTTKVNVADIVDNLTSTATNKPLSANQGKVLKGLIDTLTSSLNAHKSDTTVHITSTERTNWNSAKSHADSAHAPSNAERNIIVGIQKNGTDLSVNSTTRKVNISVPTKTSELTNDSGYKTTDTNTTYSLSKSGSTITLTGSDGSKTSVTGVTDSSASYGVATSSTPGLVKSGTDITVDSSGNVSVNDDSHNHTSIKDIGDGGATTFAYSKAGLEYANYTWLAAWNGKELRAVHKSHFAVANHSHYSISTKSDARNDATTPNDYNNAIVFSGLKSTSKIGNPSSDPYAYVVGLRGWADDSGGAAWEAGFTNSGIFVRNGATTSWGSWSKLITSDNYKTYCTPANIGAASSSHTHNYLPLAGGTLAGDLYVHKDNTTNGGIYVKRVNPEVEGDPYEGHIGSEGHTDLYIDYVTRIKGYFADFIDITGSLHGNADTATGVADYNNSSKTIKIGYDGAGLQSPEIGYIAGYKDGTGTSPMIKDISKDQLRIWLGLGSSAYTASSGSLNYVRVYNSNNVNHSTDVTVNDLAKQHAAVGMIYGATDNPCGSNRWVHVWSQAWADGVNTNWVSQIALGTSDGTGMYYRTTSDTIVGRGWTRVLDASNYNSYAPTKTGTGASGTWGINITGSAGSVPWSGITGKPDLTTKPYSAGTTAPTDTRLLWIDTGKGGIAKYYNGSSWVAIKSTWG